MSVVDQKRIAKNTALLYVRMLFIMLISLYTSRVILKTLGDIDFGLYNVIGTIVVNFSFLNGMLSSACSRYFAIELGRNDNKALKRVFSLNLTLFIILGIIILLLSETVGLWFLNNKMQIPLDRMVAAQWVYQCSIIAFIINMLSTPYRSIIIAREKMKIFAYSSIIEAVLKLVIVYMLLISPIDKLITYAVLMLLITVGTSGFYYLYCKHYYAECHYSFVWDKSLAKEIIGYTGWNVIGNFAFIGKSSGINILLNMFGGPVVNAARGIAYQVYTSINQFVSNFMMATNPQIIKAYSIGDKSSMMKLIYQSSRFSYLLLFILVLPIYLQLPLILDIWFDKVPNHTIMFTRLVLINALIDSLSGPIITAMQATGRIKWYQISVGGILLMIVVVAYIGFKFFHLPPESAFYVSIVLSFIAQAVRVVFLRNNLGFPIMRYIKEVVFRILGVTILSIIPSLLLMYFVSDIWVQFFSVSLGSIVFTGVFVYIIGLTGTERKTIVQTVRKKLHF